MTPRPCRCEKAQPGARLVTGGDTIARRAAGRKFGEFRGAPARGVKQTVAGILLALLAAMTAVPPAVRASTDAAGDRWAGSVFLAYRHNPLGLSLTGGLDRYLCREPGEKPGLDRSSFLVGGGLGVSPSTGQGWVHLEWMPHPAVVLRVEYDRFRYLGGYGSLLSFDDAGEPFGDDVLEAREGDEERADGNRLLLQPTLRLKYGPVVLRNRTDLARYWFGGRGPYFYEAEYDTLLKDGDSLVANRTDLLLDLAGGGGGVLLAGGFFDVTRADAAQITARRLGATVFWEKKRAWRGVVPRLYLQAGTYLNHPSRKGEFFALAGVGCGF